MPGSSVSGTLETWRDIRVMTGQGRGKRTVKESFRISATVNAIRYQWRGSMTEPDNLSIKIRELMDWQTVAWRRVADPDVTTFERREIRNHVKTCDDELRRCLAIKSERFRARGAVEVRGRAVDIKFRLLATEF
jgi:hypothetical protein